MGRLDDLRKLKDAAAARMAEADLGKVAGDAVTGAMSALDGAEAVAERSGLTNKKGDISRLKVAKAALRPGKSARTILGATADELQARRNVDDEGGK